MPSLNAQTVIRARAATPTTPTISTRYRSKNDFWAAIGRARSWRPARGRVLDVGVVVVDVAAAGLIGRLMTR